MVFSCYIRINKDLKSIQKFTNSLVCLNNIVHDFCQAMSTESVKDAEHGTMHLKLNNGSVTWALKDNQLYRYFKKSNIGGGRPNKSACLMMRNVLDFDVIKCLDYQNDSAASRVGFKIVLKLNDIFRSFEHHVAIRGLNLS